jgi:hypothetical protein
MPLKRIGRVSNYDRDQYDELLINVPPMPPHKAQEICDILNSIAPEGDDYYKPVDMGFVPRKREY